jgi:mannose-6-phosphate isomerase-like protein (cupin superfamily)
VEAFNLFQALEGLPELEFKQLAGFDSGNVGVYWSGSATSPWERHPENEELLYVIEGSVTIEILTDSDSVDVHLAEGSCLVVPRDHWHRHKIETAVKEMYVTPGPSETSFAEDPRISG